MFLFNNGVYALSYIDADSNIPMFYDREEQHVNKMLAPGTGVDVLVVEKNWVYIWHKNSGGWVKSKYFPELRWSNKLKRDIDYDSSTSFSKLWDEYGGSTLNFYGEGNQFANEYEEKGHRLFSYHLIKGLLEGKTNLRKLAAYVQKNVSKDSRKLGPTYTQEPVIYGSLNQDL
jgi:hypothetical protein